MSVITRRLGAKDLTVYCKGSPEMIQSLSRPETGVYKIILYFSTEIAFSVSKYLIHQYIPNRPVDSACIVCPSILYYRIKDLSQNKNEK